MEIEKSIVFIQFPLIFGRSGDVLFVLYARRLHGYTATPTKVKCSINLVGVFVRKYPTKAVAYVFTA